MIQKQQKPAEHIRELFDQRQSRTDQEILAELKALPVLPDEDDAAWNEKQTWRGHADLFVALADVAAARRLRPALPLLLERACYGDPGEMMRGLRHSLEAIVNPDWDVLTDVCIKAAKFPQRGARLWAIAELGILRDERALSVVEEALYDEAERVREEAKLSMAMIKNTKVADQEQPSME